MFRHLFATFLILTLAVSVLAQPENNSPSNRRAALRPYIRSLHLSGDGTLLAAGVTVGQWMENAQRYAPHSSELRAWDAASGRLKWKVAGKTNARTEVRFSPDNRIVIESGEWSRFDGKYARFVNSYLVIRDAESGKVLHAPELEDAERIMTTIFSPDSKFLVTGSYVPKSVPAACVKVWDVETGKLLSRHDGTHGFSNLASFTADGKSWLSIRLENDVTRVERWSFPAFKLQHSLEIDEPVAGAQALSHGEKLFAGAGLEVDNGINGDVKIWNLETGQTQAQFRPDFEDVSFDGMTFSSDGQTLILEGSYPLPGPEGITPEFTTVLWFYSSRTGELQRTLQAHETQASGSRLRYLAQLGADGNSFLATNGNIVELRSLQDGKVIREFEAVPNP